MPEQNKPQTAPKRRRKKAASKAESRPVEAPAVVAAPESESTPAAEAPQVEEAPVPAVESPMEEPVSPAVATEESYPESEAVESSEEAEKKEETTPSDSNKSEEVETVHPTPSRQVKITELEIDEPEVTPEAETQHRIKEKINFWHNFTKLFTPRSETAEESKPEEEKIAETKPDISTPEGKSMIDDFADVDIDAAVEAKLKKRNILNHLTRRKAPTVAAEAQPLLDKISRIERFNPELDAGLTSEQVATRVQQELTNRSKKKYTKSYWEIFKDNVLTFFNVLLTLIGVALIAVNRVKDCTFLVIMFINMGVGLWQEIKSKKTVDKLRLVTAPSAKVVRDGLEKQIPVEELVVDDIMILATGDQISSDSIVKEGTIEVNESLLTGESLPIKKSPGDTIYAGSFVVSGTAKALVNRVAEANWAISLQAKAKQFSKPKSELLRSMNAIIKVVSIIVLPLAGAMFAVNWINTSNIGDTYEHISSALGTTAGVVVGMVPAGMFLLTSVALAAGIIRLSKRKTLVQDLYCFEMLARTNVLCLDKTGTLTDGTMEVAEVVVLSRKYDLDALMGSYLAAFKESNQTSLALAQRYSLNSEYPVLANLPFSSSRKYSAAQLKSLGTIVLGAPEFIHRGTDNKLASVIEERQKKGYRVVMLVRTDAPIQEGGVDLTHTAPIALFVLADHIRPEAYDTIQWFQNNEVECKIISGDNPLTAAEIARACGVRNSERAISLEGLSLKEVSDVADKYTIFGRVSPEQKATLIKALKTAGKTVSMTGDGVNDILAMKQADCSIAMASGADAPRNIAHLVLLDSNFASMPAVVMEGRRVVNNIQRSSALFLMKTIFTIVMAVLFIIIGFATINSSSPMTYPFTPSDLLLMEFVGIGVPSFFLSLQPNKSRIKGRFLSNTFRNAIPGAIILLLTFWALFIMAQLGVFSTDYYGDSLNYTSPSVKAVMAMCLTFCSLGMLFCLARPFNTYRIVLFIGDILVFIGIILLFNDKVLHMPIFGNINVFPNLAEEGRGVYMLNTYEVLTLFIFAFGAPVVSSLLMAIFNPATREERESTPELPQS